MSTTKRVSFSPSTKVGKKRISILSTHISNIIKETNDDEKRNKLIAELQSLGEEPGLSDILKAVNRWKSENVSMSSRDNDLAQINDVSLIRDLMIGDQRDPSDINVERAAMQEIIYNVSIASLRPSFRTAEGTFSGKVSSRKIRYTHRKRKPRDQGQSSIAEDMLEISDVSMPSNDEPVDTEPLDIRNAHALFIEYIKEVNEEIPNTILKKDTIGIGRFTKSVKSSGKTYVLIADRLSDVNTPVWKEYLQTNIFKGQVEDVLSVLDQENAFMVYLTIGNVLLNDRFKQFNPAEVYMGTIVLMSSSENIATHFGTFRSNQDYDLLADERLEMYKILHSFADRVVISQAEDDSIWYTVNWITSKERKIYRDMINFNAMRFKHNIRYNGLSRSQYITNATDLFKRYSTSELLNINHDITRIPWFAQAVASMERADSSLNELIPFGSDLEHGLSAQSLTDVSMKMRVVVNTALMAICRMEYIR